MTTVFVPAGDWESERLELCGAEYHHLFRVSRLAAGARLRVANGRGRARDGVIETVHRDRAGIRLGDEIAGNEPEAVVELLVAAPRKPRAEWLVEKTTELGVRAVRFVRCGRGPRTYGPGTFDRFHRIARSAAEQCERSWLPEITGMHEWSDIWRLVGAAGQGLILDRSGGPWASMSSFRSVAVLVGPEGGWSPAELAESARHGLLSASLGPRTLRVETAAVVAVSRCVNAH